VKSANICVSVLYIHESYERIHTHLSLSSFIYRSVYLIIYIHIYYFILFSLAKVHESLKRGRVTDFTSAASRCSSAVNTCMSVEEQVSAFVICSPMTLPSCHCPPLLWSDPVGVRRLRGFSRTPPQMHINLHKYRCHFAHTYLITQVFFVGYLARQITSQFCELPLHFLQHYPPLCSKRGRK